MKNALRSLLLFAAFGVAAVASATTQITLSFIPTGQEKATEIPLLSCISAPGSPSAKTKTGTTTAIKPSVSLRFKSEKSGEALVAASEAGKLVASLTIVTKIEAGGATIIRTSTYTNVELGKVTANTADRNLGSTLTFTYEKVVSSEKNG